MSQKRLIRPLDPVQIVAFIVVSVFTILCFIPILMTFSASFSTEESVATHGFTILPREFTLNSYRYMIQNKGPLLLQAFKISFLQVLLGTAFSMMVTVSFSYAISQPVKVFRFARALSFIGWFTMIFSGGLLPWYILVTRYYGLQNNIFALFIPSCLNVFYAFILRGTFRGIPRELFEAARIDGAGNFHVFFRIALPLAKVGLATIALFFALGYWNDFFLSLMLTTSQRLFTMQRLLNMMMSNISFLLSGDRSTTAMQHANIEIPMLTARMTLTSLTILPVMFVYPFAQRYFVQGITIGGVKG